MIEVYLEEGAKRIFAGAVEWPGWCRSGRDADSALRALVEYGPRYAQIVRGADPSLRAPADVAGLKVVERLEGDASTDFGAPGVIPAADARPVDDAELARLQALLRACWAAFDVAVRDAAGVELRKGPRGGGRELEAIQSHVQDAERGYLARLAWKPGRDSAPTPEEERERLRRAALDAIAAAAHGEVPERGPRGGVIWPPRYFVRRAAWHVLDHVWEIAERRVD